MLKIGIGVGGFGLLLLAWALTVETIAAIPTFGIYHQEVRWLIFLVGIVSFGLGLAITGIAIEERSATTHAK